MFPVTITLHDAAQLNAVMAALNPTTAPAKVEPPKPEPKVEKPKATSPAKVEEPKQEAATAAEAPAPTPAPAASTASPAASGLTAEELTKVIVAAVARTSREAVLGLLKSDFGVSAGKEITDPAVRAQAAAKIGAL